LYVYTLKIAKCCNEILDLGIVSFGIECLLFMKLRINLFK
jgi:hypothetical protein